MEGVHGVFRGGQEKGEGKRNVVKRDRGRGRGRGKRSVDVCKYNVS